jgi:hypothetical protein
LLSSGDSLQFADGLSGLTNLSERPKQKAANKDLRHSNLDAPSIGKSDQPMPAHRFVGA